MPQDGAMDAMDVPGGQAVEDDGQAQAQPMAQVAVDDEPSAAPQNQGAEPETEARGQSPGAEG